MCLQGQGPKAVGLRADRFGGFGLGIWGTTLLRYSFLTIKLINWSKQSNKLWQVTPTTNEGLGHPLPLKLPSGLFQVDLLPLPPTTYWRLLICCLSLSFLELHLNAIIWYVIFRIWLLSLSIMPLSVIHVVMCITSSLLFIAESYSIVWMYHSVFIHLPAGRYLGYFQFEAIENTILPWTFMHKSLYGQVSIRECAGNCLATRDFPSGPVVENLPSKASSITSQETKIPHARGD